MGGVAPRRVLLKVSGEALSGEGELGPDASRIDHLADELVAAVGGGVELAIVIGAGNFVRGKQVVGAGIDRVSADHMGMLATVMNGIALQSALLRREVEARVLSALPATSLVEPYSAPLCRHHLSRGRVVILVGGTGNPFFTTDTCAALRAVEMGATWLLKGTKVDGVYSGDPRVDPASVKFDRITYREVLKRRLAVMDSTAIALCMENELPVRVFDLFTRGNIRRAVMEEEIGTEVLAVHDPK